MLDSGAPAGAHWLGPRYSSRWLYSRAVQAFYGPLSRGTVGPVRSALTLQEEANNQADCGGPDGYGSTAFASARSPRSSCDCVTALTESTNGMRHLHTGSVRMRTRQGPIRPLGPAASVQTCSHRMDPSNRPGVPAGPAAGWPRPLRSRASGRWPPASEPRPYCPDETALSAA